MEDLVNELLRPDVFHVHFERRFHERRYAHVGAALLVKLAFNGVIHQSNQTSSDDDTTLVVNQCTVRVMRSMITYSATSVSLLIIFASLIHIKQGGTHPPLASSSCVSAVVMAAGTMWATAAVVSALTR